jgi:hypothetical protein
MTLNVKDSTGATVPLKSSTESAEEVPHHAISTANGAGVTIGTTADAAVATNTTGTISGKLRGIVSLLVTLINQLPSSLGPAGLDSGSLSVTGSAPHGSASSISSTGSVTFGGATADGYALGPYVIHVYGTFVATVLIEGSIDGGTTWVPLLLHNGTAVVSSITVPGVYYSNLAGWTTTRLRCSAYTSGTVNIYSSPSRGSMATPLLPIPAGTNIIGSAGIVPNTSGGLSNYHVVSAGSTNAANIKASAGQVYGWTIYNNAAYPVYVKLHNTAGTPTAGSGVVKTIALPAGGGSNRDSDIGMAFATGIGISIVKDITDAGTTAVLASDCVVDIEYK